MKKDKADDLTKQITQLRNRLRDRKPFTKDDLALLLELEKQAQLANK